MSDEHDSTIHAVTARRREGGQWVYEPLALCGATTHDPAAAPFSKVLTIAAKLRTMTLCPTCLQEYMELTA